MATPRWIDYYDDSVIMPSPEVVERLNRGIDRERIAEPVPVTVATNSPYSRANLYGNVQSTPIRGEAYVPGQSFYSRPAPAVPAYAPPAALYQPYPTSRAPLSSPVASSDSGSPIPATPPSKQRRGRGGVRPSVSAQGTNPVQPSAQKPTGAVLPTTEFKAPALAAPIDQLGRTALFKGQDQSIPAPASGMPNPIEQSERQAAQALFFGPTPSLGANTAFEAANPELAQQLRAAAQALYQQPQSQEQLQPQSLSKEENKIIKDAAQSALPSQEEQATEVVPPAQPTSGLVGYDPDVLEETPWSREEYRNVPLDVRREMLLDNNGRAALNYLESGTNPELNAAYALASPNFSDTEKENIAKLLSDPAFYGYTNQEKLDTLLHGAELASMAIPVGAAVGLGARAIGGIGRAIYRGTVGASRAKAALQASRTARATQEALIKAQNTRRLRAWGQRKGFAVQEARKASIAQMDSVIGTQLQRSHLPITDINRWAATKNRDVIRYLAQRPETPVAVKHQMQAWLKYGHMKAPTKGTFKQWSEAQIFDKYLNAQQKFYTKRGYLPDAKSVLVKPKPVAKPNLKDPRSAGMSTHTKELLNQQPFKTPLEARLARELPGAPNLPTPEELARLSWVDKISDNILRGMRLSHK